MSASEATAPQDIASASAATTSSVATVSGAEATQYSLGFALQNSNSKSSAMFTQGPWGTKLPITTPNLNVLGFGVFSGAKISENFAVEAGVSFAKKAT